MSMLKSLMENINKSNGSKLNASTTNNKKKVVEIVSDSGSDDDDDNDSDSESDDPDFGSDSSSSSSSECSSTSGSDDDSDIPKSKKNSGKKEKKPAKKVAVSKVKSSKKEASSSSSDDEEEEEDDDDDDSDSDVSMNSDPVDNEDNGEADLEETFKEKLPDDKNEKYDEDEVHNLNNTTYANLNDEQICESQYLILMTIASIAFKLCFKEHEEIQKNKKKKRLLAAEVRDILKEFPSHAEKFDAKRSKLLTDSYEKLGKIKNHGEKEAGLFITFCRLFARCTENDIIPLPSIVGIKSEKALASLRKDIFTKKKISSDISDLLFEQIEEDGKTKVINKTGYLVIFSVPNKNGQISSYKIAVSTAILQVLVAFYFLHNMNRLMTYFIACEIEHMVTENIAKKESKPLEDMYMDLLTSNLKIDAHFYNLFRRCQVIMEHHLDVFINWEDEDNIICEIEDEEDDE